mgnify:CR=1 FL=1|jgi:predicted small secreted protein
MSQKPPSGHSTSAVQKNDHHKKLPITNKEMNRTAVFMIFLPRSSIRSLRCLFFPSADYTDSTEKRNPDYLLYFLFSDMLGCKKRLIFHERYVLRFLFLLLGFVLSGCATVPGGRDVPAAKPAWVDSPAAGCLPSELCAVGSGGSLTAAQINARAALAKIFETKIRASVTTRADVSSVDLDEVIMESADAVLNAVDVRRTYDDGGNFYALAVLNRSEGAGTAKEEMDRLDTRMELLLKEKTLPASIRLEEAYDQRAAVNGRYRVLTGTSYPEKITYEQAAAYKASMFKHRTVSVTASRGQDGLRRAVQEALSEVGYVVADAPTKNIPEAAVSVKAEPQYMNVPGFVRYTFTFRITVPDQNKGRIEVATASFSEAGRSYEQAYENAVSAFKDYLKTHIPVF